MGYNRTTLDVSNVFIDTKSEIIENCRDFLDKNTPIEEFSSIKEAKIGNVLTPIYSKRENPSSPYRLSHIDFDRKKSKTPGQDYILDYEAVMYPFLSQSEPLIIRHGRETHWDDYSIDRRVISSYRVKADISEQELLKRFNNQNHIQRTKVCKLSNIIFIPDEILARTHPTEENIHYQI